MAAAASATAAAIALYIAYANSLKSFRGTLSHPKQERVREHQRLKQQNNPKGPRTQIIGL